MPGKIAMMRWNISVKGLPIMGILVNENRVDRNRMEESSLVDKL